MLKIVDCSLVSAKSMMFLLARNERMFNYCAPAGGLARVACALVVKFILSVGWKRCCCS